MKFAEFSAAGVNETSTEMDEQNALFIAKISSMLLLGLCSFILGVLPIKLAKWLRWNVTSMENGKNSLIISLLLCFGGGVLLNTTFMHLLPEVREGMENIIESGQLSTTLSESGLNLAELLFCIGFFFVYLIDEIVHILLHTHKSNSKCDLDILHRSLSIRKCTLIPRINLDKQQSPPSTITASTQVLIRDNQYGKNMMDSLTGHITPPASNVTDPSETSSAAPSVKKTSVVKSFRSLLAVIALSFHAVFEGLAIGLEMEPKNVWYLCAAVATHKLVIAFCVGVELVTSRTKILLIILYMATFAIVSPLGIAIGLAMSHDTTDNYASGLSLASVILQGMAAGTLMYVIFFEVLQREKANTKYGLLQLFAILAGFIVLLTMGLLIGEHKHTEGSHHEHHHHHHENS